LTKEEFTLTPIRELKEYKKILDERIKEQRTRWESEKSRLKTMIRNAGKEDYPRADALARQQNEIVRAVDRLNGLVEARELFTAVKQQHNQKIKEIKENGQLIKDIQDSEEQLKAKKQIAKDKNLTIPRKKKVKDE